MYHCPRCASTSTAAYGSGTYKRSPGMVLKKRKCLACNEAYITIEATFALRDYDTPDHIRIFETLNNHIINNVRNPHANWPINTIMDQHKSSETGNEDVIEEKDIDQ